MTKLVRFEKPRFVILRKDDEIPVMAGCTTCGKKFFTPSSVVSDASGAEWYLRDRFALHKCLLPALRQTA